MFLKVQLVTINKTGCREHSQCQSLMAALGPRATYTRTFRNQLHGARYHLSLSLSLSALSPRPLSLSPHSIPPISLSVPLSLSLSVCLSVCISRFLPPSLPLSFSPLSPSFTPSLSISLSASLSPLYFVLTEITDLKHTTAPSQSSTNPLISARLDTLCIEKVLRATSDQRPWTWICTARVPILVSNEGRVINSK